MCAARCASSYEAQALYSPEREKMSTEINQHIVSAIEPRGVVVERMLLRDVDLPVRLQQAIQEKLSAEQEAARMQFVLLKEIILGGDTTPAAPHAPPPGR